MSFLLNSHVQKKFNEGYDNNNIIYSILSAIKILHLKSEEENEKYTLTIEQ